MSHSGHLRTRAQRKERRCGPFQEQASRLFHNSRSLLYYRGQGLQASSGGAVTLRDLPVNRASRWSQVGQLQTHDSPPAEALELRPLFSGLIQRNRSAIAIQRAPPDPQAYLQRLPIE